MIVRGSQTGALQWFFAGNSTRSFCTSSKCLGANLRIGVRHPEDWNRAAQDTVIGWLPDVSGTDWHKLSRPMDGLLPQMVGHKWRPGWRALVWLAQLSPTSKRNGVTRSPHNDVQGSRDKVSVADVSWQLRNLA